MKHQQLIERIHKEHEEYLNNLKQQSPDEIIRHSYETCYREEFLCLIENTMFDDETIDALLQVPNPIGILYDEWLSTDVSVADLLAETIDYFAKEC